MNDTDSDSDRLHEIAHRIWEQEGCPDGQHERHWEMAKEALAAERAQIKSSPPAGSKPNAADDT